MWRRDAKAGMADEAVPTPGRRVRLRRYAALALTIGAALIVVYFSFQTLFEQEYLVAKQSKINTWFLAQTQIEYEKLMRELDKFAPGEPPRKGDDLTERFEIFWSRLPIMIQGPQSAELRAVDGLTATVTHIIAELKRIEPVVTSLADGHREQYGNVRSVLESFRAPLEDVTRNALLYDARLDSSYRRKHEVYYYQLIAVFAVTLGGGATFFIMFYYQTSRANRLFYKALEAEKAASVARSQLLEAISSISEGFILYDQDDRVILFNDRFKELHRHLADKLRVGMTFEEILRLSIAQGAIAIEAADAEDWIKKSIARHRAPTGAFEFALGDDTWLKISERRTADGRIVGVHSDITDLKRRELELLEKSALLQATLDNMIEGICVFDASRRLICWNERFVEMHKLPTGTVRFGRKYDDLVRYIAEFGGSEELTADQQISDQVAMIANMQRLGQKRVRFERRRAGGSVTEITITLTPDGGFVKTYSDITDRVLAEEEREKLLERIHTTQKMEAIGTLAGGVAHDFNNILGIILGYGELLSDQLAKGSQGAEMLQQIQRAGERAKLLVQQILTYSRNFDCTLEPCDIGAEVRNSLELLRNSTPSNISLTLERAQSCTVAADRAQIHQILLNLVVNSVHAIGELRRGTVAVSVEIARPDRKAGAAPRGLEAQLAAASARSDTDRAGKAMRVVIGTIKDVPYCRITVRDSGGGIDPVVMNRIFEPFFTTKEVGKGTGLGLAVVYGIVRNHDGVIEVESEPDVGVTFSIYLPVLEAGVALELPANDAATANGNERVMVVDDDAILLAVNKAVLQKMGYEVSDFSDPLAALDSFRANPRGWDLIITDRNMAQLNGEQLVRRIFQTRQDMPLIMCTGYLELADEKRIMGLGVKNILMKPVTAAKLSSAIRAVFARAS
jgi:signal transduction histidine kinase/ActR/RegA family two-component response regulator